MPAGLPSLQGKSKENLRNTVNRSSPYSTNDHQQTKRPMKN